ncbi:MAG TPA: AAA family ATPase [Candidatus Moranbacteria bacterium]|nr:AAA family ATPase [Candidatus Moranbacteria bacterium]
MILLNRAIAQRIKEAIEGEKKVIIIYGPRQAGKTTLIKSLLSEMNREYEYFTGDDLYTQNIFGKNELESLKKVLKNEIVVVDEAQKIENIGLSLKLIFDNLPVKIIASGSASFDLANKLNEPLTGRTKTFWLYPLAYAELKESYRKTLPETSLEEMLRFGMYPKTHVLQSDKEKENYLYEYLNNYLYKDILAFAGVRKPKKVVDLLTLLALQIGKEVAISELAQNLSLSQKAVENYLDVLEKMFVIVNLRGFSRNLRKEISKTSKYYFMDVGLRNALIRNFNPLNLRADTGELFENWFIMEKIKAASIFGKPANFYFWRTYDQQEIDLIEERGGKLFGYEVKWKKKPVKAPNEWLKTYKNSSFEIVNNENYSGFIAE